MIGNAVYNKVSDSLTKKSFRNLDNSERFTTFVLPKSYTYPKVAGCSILGHTRIGDNFLSTYPLQWGLCMVLANLGGCRLLYYINANLSDNMPKPRKNARISGTSSAQCAGTYSCNNNGLLAPLFGERVGRIFIS